MNTYENKTVDKDQSVRRKFRSTKQTRQNVNTNRHGSELLEDNVTRKEGNKSYKLMVENVEKIKQLKIDTMRLSNKMKDFKLADAKSSSLSFNAPKEINESVQNSCSQPEKALLQKIREILNEFSPKNFDVVIKKIMDLQIVTPDEINTLMLLIFDEAIVESSSVTWYVRLCKQISEKTMFCREYKTALLDKTEYEFNIIAAESFEQTPMNSQNNLEPKRSVGVVRFIGELYNETFLTFNIVRCCIKKLMDPVSDYKLECLCEFLNTVGLKFDINPNNSGVRFLGHQFLNGVIEKMQNIVDNEVKDYVISKRVLFMLQNVIDLRKNNWNKWYIKPQLVNKKTNKYTKKSQWTKRV